MQATMVKHFDHPDEVRTFPHGRFEIVHLVGTALCHAPHTGVVISGHGVVLYETGERLDLLPGQAFYITSTPHDSWVEGEQPYVSLHVLSAPPA